MHGGEVAPGLRQAVAADLGLSEVVFVDDAQRGEIRIFTPAVELDFAGHPSVGTAWMLDGLDALQTQAGELPVRSCHLAESPGFSNAPCTPASSDRKIGRWSCRLISERNALAKS